jgi:hypothetical protein
MTHTLKSTESEEEKAEVIEQISKLTKEAFHCNLKSRLYFSADLCKEVTSCCIVLHTTLGDAKEMPTTHDDSLFLHSLEVCEKKLSDIADAFHVLLFGKT